MNPKNIIQATTISLLISPHFLCCMQNPLIPPQLSAQYSAAQLLSESEPSPQPAHPDTPIATQLPPRTEKPSAKLALDGDREIHFRNDSTNQDAPHSGMRTIRAQQRMRVRRNSIALESNLSRDFSQDFDSNKEPIRPRRHSSFEYNDTDSVPLVIHAHHKHKQMNAHQNSSLGIYNMHHAAPHSHNEQHDSLAASDMHNAARTARARHERHRSLGASDMHNAARTARAHHEHSRTRPGRNNFGADDIGSAVPPMGNRPHARPRQNSFEVDDIGTALPPMGNRPHTRPRRNSFEVDNIGTSLPPMGNRPHARPRRNSYEAHDMGNAAPPMATRPHARPERNNPPIDDRDSAGSVESAHTQHEYEQEHNAQDAELTDNIFQNLDPQENNEQDNMWLPSDAAADTIDGTPMDFEKSDYSQSSIDGQGNNQQHAHPRPHSRPHSRPRSEQQRPQQHNTTRDYEPRDYTNYGTDDTPPTPDVDWDQVYQFRDYPLIAFLIIVYSQYPKTTVASIALLGALAIWKHDVVMGWWQGAKEKANNVIDFSRKNLNSKIASLKAATLLKVSILKKKGILTDTSLKLITSGIAHLKTL